MNEVSSSGHHTYCGLTCGVPGDFIPALMHALHPHQLSDDLGRQHDLIHTNSVLTSSLVSVPAH